MIAVGSDSSFVMESVSIVIFDLFVHGSLAYRRYCIITFGTRENENFYGSSAQGV